MGGEQRVTNHRHFTAENSDRFLFSRVCNLDWVQLVGGGVDLQLVSPVVPVWLHLAGMSHGGLAGTGVLGGWAPLSPRGPLSLPSVDSLVLSM